MSATNADTTTSTPQFISALVLGAVMVGAFTLAMMVLYKKFPRVYQARYELAPDGKRPPRLEGGFFSWWKQIFKEKDEIVREMNGVDAYLFLRFIKVFGLYMMVPYFLLTFIILIPIAATGGGGLSGLNQLTFGNVAPDKTIRLIAWFLVALVLIPWTMYLIFHEYQHLIKVRQAWFSSDAHQRSASARTVMLVNVPKDIMSEGGLRELASSIGGVGNVQNIWLAKNVKKLEKVYDDRDKECARLEKAEAKLLAKAAKNERKGKTPKGSSNAASSDENVAQALSDPERADADSIVDKYLSPKEKGKITWKQGFLGLIGTKMDRKQSPAYIRSHNEELEKMRQDANALENGNVAWLRFNTQQEAHTFARMVNRTKERKLVVSSVEVLPEDIQWSNTSMNPHERKIRTLISWGLTIGLIIIWSIPVAFVGAVSNVDTLCATASWLAWICKLPSPVVGIIKGILPPVLLALLFMLLPIVLRIWVKLQGVVRKSDIEVRLFNRYWAFQVIQGFLIITLASGLISALGNLGETASSVPTLLAQKLPTASIFFLTFILATTFSGAAQSYSRVVPSVMYLLRGFLSGNTPRKFYASQFKMQSFMWATVWPPICLLICITIVYSTIQPVIVLVAMVAFGLLYGAYKYILGWCADQPDELESGGLFYPKVLTTVIVSLYIEEVCLMGLFFLATDQNDKRSKAGLAGGVIMAVTIAATAAFQIYLKHRFSNDSIVYAPSSFLGSSSSTTKLNMAPTADGDSSPQMDGPVPTVEHERAFDHPALWKKQPVIWIANDELGISDAEVNRLVHEDVDASNQYAQLNRAGKLTVERGPPDEPWFGPVKPIN